MFRNDLRKLSVTLVLSVATAVVSVTAVAAADKQLETVRASGGTAALTANAAPPASDLTPSERYFGQQAEELMRAQQVYLAPLTASSFSASEIYYGWKPVQGQESDSVTYGSAEWVAALRVNAALAQ